MNAADEQNRRKQTSDAMKVVGILASVFSDRRGKKNIRSGNKGLDTLAHALGRGKKAY